MMQRRQWVGTMAMIFSCVVLLGGAPAMAGAKKASKGSMRQMMGKIAAIDAGTSSLVVEVAEGKEQFTVGGPLSDKAMVKKGGKTVQLSALKVGDQVKVQWHQSAAGHVIDQVHAMK